MPNEVKSLNEECGVFGIWGDAQAAELTYFGLHALQHRGQEGAGIAVLNTEKRISRERGMGLLADVFSDAEKLSRLSGRAAIGHVRYGTAGSRGIANVQPLSFHFVAADYALAHNGNLTNALTLRRALEDDGAYFQSDSDSEVLMHLIQRQAGETFEKKLAAALRQIRGGFAYVVLTAEGLYAALDPNGFRPLVIGQLPTGAFVVTSETAALNVIGARFLRDVEPGELVCINDQGCQVKRYTDKTQLAICSMEFIYFSRPDSTIRGVNVHQARQRMGARLAAENPLDIDIVVGVPNSSLSAASGAATAYGVPNEMGLIKNQYSTRTFIQPTQSLRERGVKMKLSALEAVVAGKRVALVDDSLVRGTTSKHIVRILREAGAQEVHLLIASPPLRYPCFYGIDIEKTQELLAANHTVEEMRAMIDADSLHFLSLPGLIDAIGLRTDAPNGGLCVAYFDGHYPTPLYDYEAGYLPPKTAAETALSAVKGEKDDERL